MSEKNILIIQCDQLAAGALPAYGNKVAQVPHFDSICEDGVVFTTAYCNSPLCAPSRFSMLSGRYASRIGAYDNGAEFSADIPTFAHYLRLHCYRTSLCGKMHFVGADQLHGFEERLTTDVYPADHGWTPDWTQPEKRFDWWYHNMDSVVHAGCNERANQIDFDDDVGFHAERHIFDLARSRDTRPFCFVVSFTNPHDPYVCPREYWDRYDHESIDMPRVDHIPYEQCDAHSRRLRDACAMGAGQMAPEHIRNARHAYYGQLSYLDDKIGRLLQALEATGLRKDTVIILTADHGDMLGERGLWYKMSPYEGASRVPLVINAPEQFSPRRVDTPVSLVDLLPTLLELADLRKVDTSELDGSSLVPLASGLDRQTRAPVICEYLGEGAVAPIIMLRNDRYKFVHCPADPAMLFDMQEDPDELVNLAANPDFQGVRAMFEELVAAHANVEELNERILASQRRRRIVFGAHMAGKHTAWDYHPPCHASEEYMRNHLDLNVVEAEARLAVEKHY